jgi:hypothetical protein
MRKIAILLLMGGLIASANSQTNTFPASGNAGVGTTSPGYPLEVNGVAQIDGNLNVGNGSAAAKLFMQSPSGSNWSLTTGSSVFNFTDSAGVSVLSLCDSGAGCNGRVGIGTSSPQAGLDLEVTTNPTGGGPSMGLNVYNTVTTGSTTDYPQNHLQSSYTGSATQSFLYGSANSVYESGTGALTNAYAGLFRVYNNSTGAITNGYGVSVSTPNGGGPITNAYGVSIAAQSTTGVTNAYGVYQVGSGDTNYFAGKIGIGTASPGATLEVDGNVKLTASSGASIIFQDGTTQNTAYTGVTCGGDYAESVDVSGDRTKYTPGDVLVIDPDNPGKFLKSVAPYSTSVTGIYSTKPGTIGRRQSTPQSPDEVPMAMIGIVPTKVTAENGAIRPGDLLVTSSTIGYAMKGTDRGRMLGAIIGKALGNLESDTGVIEVLVSLQ